MALTQRQDIRLTQTQRLEQRLVMTPKLQQAIKLLLMTRLEMLEQVDQEMLQNPMLEELEPDEERAESLDEEGGSLEGDNLESLGSLEGLESQILQTNKEEQPDIDWKEVFEDNLNPSEKSEWEDIDDEDLPRKDIATHLSLHDHLLSQLHMLRLSEVEYQIGEMILWNIDEDGRLNVNVEEIAEGLNRDRSEAEKLPVSEVERVLSIIQGFEPTGVAARNLQECLLIQLRAAGMENSLEARVIRDHFEDLAENRLPKIAKDLGVDLEGVMKVKEAITQFEPKPGREFAESRDADIIIPEVIVEKVDGEYRVMPNDDGMPRLRLSKSYLRMLQNDEHLTSEAREWLENCKRTAIDLLKSIEQRRRTIIKVTESIFKIQRDFLEKGVNYLKPLGLRQIADMIDMHESTVSRVTTRKYVQTPRGIFELKFFFSSGLESEKGDDISATSVKELIKEIVDGEEPASPLSDREIVQILKKRGIKAARRTVAKYRDELNLPPSSRRRTKW